MVDHDFGYSKASIWRYARIPNFEMFGDEKLFATYFGVHQMRWVLAHQFDWDMMHSFLEMFKGF